MTTLFDNLYTNNLYPSSNTAAAKSSPQVNSLMENKILNFTANNRRYIEINSNIKVIYT